jgi:hypothetical protein
MRAARGYESPTAILNPGQLPILEPELYCVPEPYRNRDDKNYCLCNPYWMQHLVQPQASGQLRNGNKVGSPVSTLAGLPTPGMEACPIGPVTRW